MDSDKEEATRAKEIVEKKMQVKDFVGAKKVALKIQQQLFSDLDNISQMLTVCEVHCCAGTKVNGEKDWYGILQVEQTADESSLKKQYSKLALLLHPDRNKFPGAEAALKLIGEANMILSDRAKRSMYDMKRRGDIMTVLRRQPSYQTNMTTFARKQPGVGNDFTSTASFHSGNINQQQPGHAITFWTMCPKCRKKFQYYRTLLNKSIQCHNCLTYYTASEFVEHAVPRPSDSSANLRNHTGVGSEIDMTHGNGGFKSRQNEVPPEKVNTGKLDNKDHPVKSSATDGRRMRARKVVVDSSDSDSDTSSDNEDADLEDGVRPEKQHAPFHSGNINQQQPTFWTMCPKCCMKFQYYRTHLNKSMRCHNCLICYTASELVEQAVSRPSDSSANLRNHTGFGSEIDMTHGNCGFKSRQNEVPPEKVNTGKMDKKDHPVKSSATDGRRRRARKVVVDSSNSVSDTSSDNEDADLEDGVRPEKQHAPFHYGNINQQQPTFWTMCQKCCMKFQYYRTLLNKSICCHNCSTYYTASEFVEQAVPRLSDGSANLRNHTGCGSEINMTHGKGGGFRSKQNEVPPEKVNIWKMNKDHPDTSSAAIGHRRARKVVVDSGHLDSDSGTDNEDVDLEDGVRPEEQNACPSSGRHPRRSYRMKQNVTYKEARIEDEDFPSPCKRARKAAPHHANDHLIKDTSEKRVPNGGESVKTYNAHESEQAPNVRSFSSPDSEFYDFEQERATSKFVADQIWAVYDELDAMPRYYVWIREVCDPFRLHFTWLDHNPLSESEEVWTHEDLPVASGNYRLGNSATAMDVQMFSHPTDFNRGTKSNTYDIYPRKGEVWALFKGWDVNWTSDANNHRLYEYEVVKVISDISDGSEFHVVHLLRVQGFVSLFVPSTVHRKTQVLLAEVLRFSHRIPSYKIPDSERDGVAGGFYELDTAALPNSFGDTFPSVNVDTTAVSAQKLNFNSKENFSSSNINDDYLQSEFHDFKKDRLIEKLKCGQIWALYCDIDQYPKYYAKIKKVNVEDIVLSVSWVELHATREDEASWVEKVLPATCGRFEVDYGITTFESIDSFSHIVHANSIGQRADKYDIYPRIGEVWAIYKDWSVDWTQSDLGKCKYYVAEILEVGNSVVKAVLLNKVADHISVFEREASGDVEKMMEIPLNENLRFSHQIPAFRLTNEFDGVLKGCWELDPASVPDRMFF